MRRAVALSPHLDDAVFSIGAHLAGLAADGWEVVVATAFTRSVPDPTGFALSTQLDKGLDASVDYLALRRAEDVAACAALGAAAPVHLDLPEAPHRGYHSAEALFDAVRADDAGVVDELAALVGPLVATADRVYLPMALGGHVDHEQVLRAAVAAGVELASGAWLWVDQPYALTRGEDAPVSPLVPGGRRRGLKLEPAALARKLDACAAYATQLGFQFGGEAQMREALAAAPERVRPPAFNPSEIPRG